MILQMNLLTDVFPYLQSALPTSELRLNPQPKSSGSKNWGPLAGGGRAQATYLPSLGLQNLDDI